MAKRDKTDRLLGSFRGRTTKDNLPKLQFGTGKDYVLPNSSDKRAGNHHNHWKLTNPTGSIDPALEVDATGLTYFYKDIGIACGNASFSLIDTSSGNIFIFYSVGPVSYFYSDPFNTVADSAFVINVDGDNIITFDDSLGTVTDHALEVQQSTYLGSGGYGTYFGARSANIGGVVRRIQTGAVAAMQFFTELTDNLISFVDGYAKNDTYNMTQQTNPTIYIFSATRAATATNQWLSFCHDQTDGLLSTGTGGIKTNVDLFFTGDGSGLPYGSCYGNHIGWSQANAVQNTWYNISDADMNDGELNLATHDGNGKLTVTKAGRYLINYNICLEDTQVNDHIEVGIEISGSGSANNAGQSHLEINTASQEVHLSGTAILDLAASATIEIAIRTTDNNNPTIGVQSLNITCTQVGGT